MSNLREILTKKILEELYSPDSESTHYDTVGNRKIKIFPDTIDSLKNTVRAEITTSKSKGLFTVVNLDNLVDLNPSKMVAENYPLGAENDSRAPWNQSVSSEVSSYSLDDNIAKITVQLNNGNEFEVDYIDFLNEYWNKNHGMFEKHSAAFEHLDDKMDIAVVRQLDSEKVDFSSYLYSIAEKRNLLSNGKDEFDIDFEED